MKILKLAQIPKVNPFPIEPDFEIFPPPYNPLCKDFLSCFLYYTGIILNILIVSAFGLAVIFLIWAGIRYITTSKEPDEIKTTNKMFIWALVGLVVALLSWPIARAIKHFLLQSFQG